MSQLPTLRALCCCPDLLLLAWLQLMGPDALWAIHANRITMQPKDGLPMRCIPRTAL